MSKIKTKKAVKLIIEPEKLNFGYFNPKRSGSKSPSIDLEVRNESEEIINGRLIPRVSWILVPKIQFALKPGESSQHQISLSTGVPAPWKKSQYDYDSLLQINSDAGIYNLAGSYHTGKRRKPLTRRSIIIIILTVFLVALIGFGAYAFSSGMIELPDLKPEPTIDANLIHTQGAQTVIARVTQTWLYTTPTVTPSNTPQPSPTDLNLEHSPTPAISATAGPTITLTPWPRDEFSNPEDFIFTYFEHLNAEEYELAWEMLSENFKEECCSVGGNEPYTTYQNWYEYNIDQIEVYSAYLQKWDANPANVLVQLKFIYKDGETEDAVFMYYLISDADIQKLLIDEVQ